MKLKENTVTFNELLFYSTRYTQLSSEDLTVYLIAKAAFPKLVSGLNPFTPKELIEKIRKDGEATPVQEENITRSLERIRKAGLMERTPVKITMLDKNGNEIGYGSKPAYAVI